MKNTLFCLTPFLMSAACGAAESPEQNEARIQAAMKVHPILSGAGAVQGTITDVPCSVGDGLYVLCDLLNSDGEAWLGWQVIDADRIEVAFGSRQVDFSQVAHVELVNCSSSQIDVEPGTFTGGDDLYSEDRVFRKDGWTGLWPLRAANPTIGHYHGAEFTLWFTPNAPGDHAAEFIMRTHSSRRPKITFTLKGTGTP